MVGVRCDNALAHKTSTPVGSLASGLTIANPGPRRAYVAALLILLFILILGLVHTLPFISTVALFEIGFFAKHAKQR